MTAVTAGRRQGARQLLIALSSQIPASSVAFDKMLHQPACSPTRGPSPAGLQQGVGGWGRSCVSLQGLCETGALSSHSACPSSLHLWMTRRAVYTFPLHQGAAWVLKCADSEGGLCNLTGPPPPPPGTPACPLGSDPRETLCDLVGQVIGTWSVGASPGTQDTCLSGRDRERKDTRCPASGVLGPEALSTPLGLSFQVGAHLPFSSCPPPLRVLLRSVSL